MVKLVKDWPRVLLIGYSTYAFYGLALVFLLPDLIYMFAGLDTNPKVWTVLGLMLIVFGAVGRLLQQPKDGAWWRRGFILTILALTALFAFPAIAQASSDRDEAAFELISKWEGENKVGEMHVAYIDLVGVVTIVTGHTRTARLGQWKTDAECKDLLIEEIDEYRDGLHVYFTATTRIAV